MLIAAAGYWGLGLPTAWVLAFHTGLGPVGIWLGLTMGLAGAAALLFFRVRHVLWQAPFERLRTNEAMPMS
jgi:MATE family multidrug resistance protein